MIQKDYSIWINYKIWPDQIKQRTYQNKSVVRYLNRADFFFFFWGGEDKIWSNCKQIWLDLPDLVGWKFDPIRWTFCKLLIYFGSNSMWHFFLKILFFILIWRKKYRFWNFSLSSPSRTPQCSQFWVFWS